MAPTASTPAAATSGGGPAAGGRSITARALRRRLTGAKAGIAGVALGLALVVAGIASGGTPFDLHLVPPGTDTSGVTDLVEFDGATFSTVEAALSGSTSATVPVDLPGMPAVDLSGSLEIDSGLRALSLATGSIPAADVFGVDSPLAGTQVELLFTARWADGADTTPDLALAVKTAAADLDGLNRLWAPVESAVPGLADTVLVVAGAGFDLDPALLPPPAGTFYSGPLTPQRGVVLSGDVDLGTYPALGDAASFLGADLPRLPISGTLAGTGAVLIDPALPSDAALSDLSLEIAVPDFSLLPGWVGTRDATFTLGLGSAPSYPPSVVLDDVVTTTFGGATNSFERSVGLAEARLFSARIDAVSPFTAPFGLDWLGLSDVTLDLALDTGTGAFSGELGAALTIVGPSPDTTVSILIEAGPDGAAGTVRIAGDASLDDLISFLTRPGAPFEIAGGLDTSALAGIVVQETTFAYESAGGTTTLVVRARGEVQGLAVDFLITLIDTATATPRVLVGLRVTEPDDQCVGCIRLGTVLDGLEGTAAGDLQLPEVNLAVLLPSGDPLVVADLPQPSQDFFAGIYTEGLPATLALDGNLNLFARLGLDPLGPAVRDFFGYDPGASVVLRGSLGVTLGSFNGSFSPALSGFSLEATLPTVRGPKDLPDWLQFDTSLQWTVGISYAEGDPATTADDTVTVVGSSVMTSTLLSDTPVGLTVSAEIAVSESRFKVAVSAEMDPWPDVFGIDWLDLDGITLQATMEETGTPPATTFTVSLEAGATIGGKEFDVELAGRLGRTDFAAIATLRLTGEITIAEIFSVFGLDLGGLGGPAATMLGSFGLSDATFRVAITDGPGGTELGFLATGTVGFNLPGDGTGTPKLSADLLFTADTTGNITFGIKFQGPLTFGRILEGIGLSLPVDENGDPVLPDFEVVSSETAFGLYLSTTAVTIPSADLDPAVRAFFDPFFSRGLCTPDNSSGCEQNFVLRTGVSVGGVFALPEPLAGFLSDTLGMSARVEAQGTIPIFDPADPLHLELRLRIEPTKLPEWIGDSGLFVTVDADLTAASIRLGLGGDLTLKFKSGMPADLAAALGSVGVPVDAAVPVASTATCPNGSTPLPAEEPTVAPAPGETPTDFTTRYYCYDQITFTVAAALEVGASQVGVTIIGEVDPLFEWNPFGLRFFGLYKLRIELGVTWKATAPPPGVTIEAGFNGKVAVGEGTLKKDLDVAVKVGFTPLPYPPFVSVDFSGLRAASGAGLALSDFFDLQHEIALTAWEILGSPGTAPTRIDTAGLGIPNIAFRNLQFSISPKPTGVPTLCIPFGLVIGADLYLDPTVAPTAAPECNSTTGELEIAPAVSCSEQKDEGCFARGLLDIGKSGFKGLFQLNAFDIGPIHWQDAEVDIAVALDEQHFRMSGGITIDDVVNPANSPFAAGELALSLEPLAFDFFGRIEVLGFSALADGRAGLDLLNPSASGLFLHVLLASSQADTGEPDFNAKVAELLDPILNGVGTTLIVADGIIEDLKTLDLANVILNLPDRLAAAGVDVPQWLYTLRTAIGPTLDLLPTDLAGQVVDVVLNGTEIHWPTIELGYSYHCWVKGTWLPGFQTAGRDRRLFTSDDGCWNSFLKWKRGDLRRACVGEDVGGTCYVLGFGPRPPLVIGGICNAIFPPATTDVRNAQGKCVFAKIIDNEITPLFQDVLDALVPGLGDVSLTDLGSALQNASTTDIFTFDCAEFTLQLDAAAQFVELGAAATFFGNQVGFNLGWDFAGSFAANVDNLAQSLFEALFGGGSPQDFCSGLNTSVFEETGGGYQSNENPPPPQVGFTLDTANVPEGATVTMNGTFSRALEAARTLTIEWGDGATETVVVAGGAAAFTRTHVYTDDDPTGTPNDLETVTVTDPESATRTVRATLTVNNVAPVVTTVTTDATILENETATLAVAFTDPGTADVHRVEVAWGDGTSSVETLAVGARTATFVHLYRDDDPTGTPADGYTIRVTVTDDDVGVGRGDVATEVRNVAPHSVTLTPDPPSTVILEGTFFESRLEFLIQFADPGTTDTHLAEVDWDGDGTFDLGVPLAGGARSVVVSHWFPDDHPLSGTPFDDLDVTVRVTDDDTGSGQSVLPIRVENVAPRALDLELHHPDDPDEAPPVTTFAEGDVVRLVGGFLDPGSGPFEEHVVAVDWGDGTPPELHRLDVGERGFILDHLYVDDDPTGTPADPFTITVTVEDDDTGVVTGTIAFTLEDVAPVVVAGPDRATDEGSVVAVFADFTDAGLRDTHVATIDWGDGTGPEPVAAPSASGSGFTEGTHVYADNGTYTVTFAVTDDDTLTGYATLLIEVANVLPTIEAGSDQRLFEDDPIALDPSDFHDQGTLDTHTAIVDWGDGTPPATGWVTEAPFGPPGSVNGADGVIDARHVYPDPGIYTVTVCVADDDQPDTPVCDTFRATIVHGFVRMAVFGGADPAEDRSGHGPGKVTTDKEVVVAGWVGATGEVQFDQSVLVSGSVVSVMDRVKIDKYGRVAGAVIAGTEVHFKKGVWVSGDVHAGTKTKIDAGATVAGTVFTGAAATAFPEVTWFTAGVPDRPKTKLSVNRTTISLPPGDYGKVEVKHGSLLLQAGTYRLRELKLHDSALLLDLDPDGDGVPDSLVVLATRKVDLEGPMEVVSAVGDASNVIFVVGHTIDLRKDAAYLGTFLTDHGDVEVHKDAAVEGALYGRKVKLKEGVQVTYRPAIDAFVDLFVPVIR